MKPLGPAARSLIDAAEGGDEPSASDAVRVRAKLAARLTMAAAAGVAATIAVESTAAGGATLAGAGASAGGATLAGAGASAGVGAAWSGVGVGTKVLLAVALIGGATATGALARRGLPVIAHSANVNLVDEGSAPSSNAKAVSKDVPALETASTSTAPSMIARAVADLPDRAPGAKAPGPSVTRTIDRAPHGSPRAVIAASSSMSPNVGEAPTSARDPVAEEALLLRAAQAALARGDGAAALTRLDEHATRFPRGALIEEGRAARVFALCAGGRAAEARLAASAFVRASPRSPLAAQVRRSCAANADEPR